MTPLRSWIGHDPSARWVRRAPVERGACGFQQTGGGQRHRVLDVVPRIGVAAVGPRDGARGLLGGGDRLRGLPALRGRQDTRHAGNVRIAATGTSGLLEVQRHALADQRVEQRLGRPVSHGRLTMSHTSSLW